MSTCTIEGCDLQHMARGWCSKHYSRWQRHGDPLVTVRKPPSTADAAEKHCPRCGNVKPIGGFGKRPNGRPKGYCRECEAAYQRKHAATEHGREQHRAARSRWNESNHAYFIDYRYGLSADDYARMLDEQGGRCAICATPQPGGRDKVWHVDHCHDSNRVRGLLCGLCNRGLGQFKDDPARVRAAADYLERKM